LFSHLYVWFAYSMDCIYLVFWISSIIVLFVLWFKLFLFYSYFYLYLLISILFWFDEWHVHIVCIFFSATNGAQLGLYPPINDDVAKFKDGGGWCFYIFHDINLNYSSIFSFQISKFVSTICVLTFSFFVLQLIVVIRWKS
jgi:hypothetical protein